MIERSDKYEVIIVGSGPAGATTASMISKRGFRTLLIDKSDFPRDKSCGDGLTRTTTKLLHRLGLLGQLSGFQKIYGANVFLDKEGSREFNYPQNLPEPNFGLVVPRFELDNVIHQSALESGVDFIGKVSFEDLLYNDNGKVIGIQLGNGKKYFADIVIAADGAASKIAYQAGLAATPKNKLGFGLRAYYKNITNLTDKLEIYLPILDSSYTRILPSYGWVFPVGKNTANIGVGLIEKIESNNIQTVMEVFVAKLRSIDPRFKEMQLDGKFIGAPMRFDFQPRNTYAPGLLLTGDAAGLISPFTGEGIGYAIETGMLAADYYLQLKENDEKDFIDLSGYGNILAAKYQGYFETGITAVNRYHMVWKVLKSTFQNDKPLFNAIRQATVFPEAIGESFFDHYTEDVSALIKKYNAEIRTDMLAISGNLIDITRTDWPFLSRLFSAKQITPGIPFRPAMFLLLSGYCDKTDRDAMIRIGTALELGFAASLCHESVIEDHRLNGSPNWGNMTSILLGDFLLSKSFEIIASLETKYSSTISEAFSISNKGYVLLKNILKKRWKSFSIEDYIEHSYLKNKYSFELFLHLGGMLKKAPTIEINELKDFGRHFGTAYFLIEDTLRYLERIKYPHTSKTNIFYAGDEQLSLINVLTSQNGKDIDYSIKICFETAKAEMQQAIIKINNFSDEPLRQSLQNICNFVMKKSHID